MFTGLDIFRPHLKSDPLFPTDLPTHSLSVFRLAPPLIRLLQTIMPANTLFQQKTTPSLKTEPIIKREYNIGCDLRRCDHITDALISLHWLQAMLRRRRRWRFSRTGGRHTCSAAATKLFDFQLHSPFLVIISPQEQWSLQYFLLFRPL